MFTWRDTFGNGEKKAVDVERRVVVVDVEQVDVDLQYAEETQGPQQCHVERQSTDGGLDDVATDHVTVDLTRRVQHAAATVHLDILAAVCMYTRQHAARLSSATQDMARPSTGLETFQPRHVAKRKRKRP